MTNKFLANEKQDKIIEALKEKSTTNFTSKALLLFFQGFIITLLDLIKNNKDNLAFNELQLGLLAQLESIQDSLSCNSALELAIKKLANLSVEQRKYLTDPRSEIKSKKQSKTFITPSS